MCTISDVGFLLNGQLLPNNSAVTWMEIGEGSAALFCLTSNTNCCESTSPLEQWNFPDGSVHLMNTDTIYQEYGKNSILLIHQVGTQSVNGIFDCQIRDQDGQLNILYIGIYQDHAISKLPMHCDGHVFLSLFSKFTFLAAQLNNLGISFDLIDDLNISFILTCTSMGGPISQMLWQHNGNVVPSSSPFPVLVDAENGLYYSTLHIDTRIAGVYSCMIMDGLNFSLIENHTVQGMYCDFITVFKMLAY